MMSRSIWKTSCAALALSALLVPAGAAETPGARQYRQAGGLVSLSPGEKLDLLRRHIKYVFVIFQENRSFDHYFSTYPGADGLFANGQMISAPGTVQRIRNTDGSYANISPFLIPRTIRDVAGNTVPLYPEDTFSVDHSHDGMLNGLHFDQATQRIARNDGYALDQEGLRYAGDDSSDANVVNAAGVAPTANPTLAQKQAAELVMAHLDCDTIPFLWQYADRFTLFDAFHQTTIGPSTPNAIAMIAGQTGETQWALHSGEADAKGLTLPVATDRGPFPGSNADTSPGRPAYGPDENPAHPQMNLTFATLPLSFMGEQVGKIVAADPDPTADLLDVQDDIKEIGLRNANVPWGWFQQGFDAEPFDGTTTADGVAHALHGSYIVHHNGPQYFGYLGDNPQEQSSLHGLQDFYAAIASHALPDHGVFYVRGGFYNNDGLVTLNPNPTVRKSTPGNDDHPNYSDAQISEASVADTVNAIANSPYWSQSAIIITYDETDGLYDHVQPHVRAIGPDGLPLTAGPRIPAIMISPYSAAHTISHAYSEHSSVIRFIDELFSLVPLADLPDEQRGRDLGAAQAATFNQPDLGPADDKVQPMGDLTEAFDTDRLIGAVPPLPPSYATIPAATITSLPHYGGAGCKALGITPTDYVNGAPIDPPPADFNPRPVQSPGIPTAGNWTP
jgi:phospholipase C